MLNDSVFSDISARCAGNVRIGVMVAGGRSPASAFNSIMAEKGRAADGGAYLDCGSGEAYFEFCEGLENCSAAIVVTDGAAADDMCSSVMRAGLPWIVVADGGNAEMCAALQSKWGVPALSVDCGNPSADDAETVLRAILFEFPLTAIDVRIPSWVRSLPASNSAVAELCKKVKAGAEKVNCMREASSLGELLTDSANWQPDVEMSILPAEGRAVLTVKIKDGAFFDMLSETAGEKISDESSLMSFVVSAADARRNYDKIKDALECARVTGYGIVRPADDDLSLEKPSVVRQGQNVGVKLKASAPSYHIIKVDVGGEVSPIMGAASQSEGMVGEIMNGFENDPQGMWNTNLFGKSLREMVQEGLAGKVNGMQEETRVKMRKAITRIVNEGKGGVICILL